MIVREGFRKMLGLEDDFEIVGEAPDHAAALVGVAETQPDVVLLDMVVGPVDPGFAAALQEAAPQTRILILSGHPPERVDPELLARAVAHVPKSTAFDELAGAIRAAVSTNVR